MNNSIGSGAIKIVRIAEDMISAPVSHSLAQLQQVCFGYNTSASSYFKQIPHFRYVAFKQTQVVAQLGIDHRIMNFDGVAKRVFGLINLCVESASRHEGLASTLIKTAEQDAVRSEVGLVLLLTKNSALYEKHGYQYLNAKCTWLGIDDEHERSIGLLSEDIICELMVKGVSDACVEYAEVDFLGYMF